MAWWNDVLDLVRQELSAAATPAPHAEPASVQRAQNLLRRTSRELVTARTRADALRKRLARTQADLEKLTRAQGDARYRERLAALAQALQTQSALAGGFATHIAQLDTLHDRVERELRRFERDVAMARSAHAAREATSAATRGRAKARPQPAGEPGFAHARPDAVMRRLKDLATPPPRRRRSRDED